MYQPSDLYENAARAYLQWTRKECIAAADAIDDIWMQYDAHAALLAGVILALFKMEVKQNHWIPGLHNYEHMMSDYPGALPLLQAAMNCCLESWDIVVDIPSGWIRR